MQRVCDWLAFLLLWGSYFAVAPASDVLAFSIARMFLQWPHLLLCPFWCSLCLLSWQHGGRRQGNKILTSARMSFSLLWVRAPYLLLPSDLQVEGKLHMVMKSLLWQIPFIVIGGLQLFFHKSDSLFIRCRKWSVKLLGLRCVYVPSCILQGSNRAHSSLSPYLNCLL